jgi:hypothetical protein
MFQRCTKSNPVDKAASRRCHAVESTASASQVVAHQVRHCKNCSRCFCRRTSKMPDGNSCLTRPRSRVFNLTLFGWLLECKRERKDLRSSLLRSNDLQNILRARQAELVSTYCRSAPNFEPSRDFAKRLGCGWLVNLQRRVSVESCWDSFLRTNREDKSTPDPPLAITECRNPSPFLGLAIRLKSISPENFVELLSHHPCP